MVTVSDANGRTRSSTVTCTVYGALTISTPPALAPGFAGGVPYSLNLAAAGGRSPYTWALVSGSLPSPLTLSSTGTISGTPASAGTSTFTVRVTDANTNTTTKALTLGIVPAPSITTASLDDGYIGVAYAITVQAQDGSPPYTFSLTGALPNGLSLNASTGQISGTPSSAASANVTVTLTDANGLTASAALPIAVFDLPQITTPSPLPDGYATQGYSVGLASTGGKGPLSWTVAAGALPSGLTLNAGTGVIGPSLGLVGNGQPFSFTVNLTDANGKNASRAYGMTGYVLPSITNGSLATATEGITYMRSPGAFVTILAANGKTPYAFSATGLPGGLVVDGPTGRITGIPSQATAGRYTVTLKATDANGKVGQGRAPPGPSRWWRRTWMGTRRWTWRWRTPPARR